MASGHLKRLLMVGLFIVITVVGYLSYRGRALDNLYAEAKGYPPFFHSSNESRAAVQKLATYRGQRSARMLLDLALQKNPVALEVQSEAIKALGNRKDPSVAKSLSAILQPHEDLRTRQAAATALQNLPCPEDCIRACLHYLERVWRGELNYEDTIVQPTDFASVSAALRKDQEALYNTLYSTLKRNKSETLRSLISVYGLGSSDPSVFGLNLVSQLGFTEACPYLRESDRQFKDFSPETFRGPRRELQTAEASLKCQ